MPKFIDITGNHYGFLDVLYHDKEASKRVGKTLWMCKCECGNYKNCESNKLRTGRTVSCGCRRTDRPHITHGKTKDPLYQVWRGMKDRCLNPNSKERKYYGGRGIEICDQWKDDFQAFYDWSINNGYAKGLSIDRIDNNGNYSPDNCRWATRSMQARNKRDTVIVNVCGITKPLAEWSEISGVHISALRERYRKGKKVGVLVFNYDFLRPSKNSKKAGDCY